MYEVMILLSAFFHFGGGESGVTGCKLCNTLRRGANLRYHSMACI